jgi:hypothetical protein
MNIFKETQCSVRAVNSKKASLSGISPDILTSEVGEQGVEARAGGGKLEEKPLDEVLIIHINENDSSRIIKT